MKSADLACIAKQYQDAGYDVLIHPSLDERPEFLRRFELDMIARKGRENVVVEVKTRQDLRHESELSFLAAQVNDQPGWRFDLVVIGGGDSVVENENAVEELTEPSAEQIGALANRAESLIDHGELEASCLVAWSAAEAALRKIAQRERVVLEHRTPAFVLKTLLAEGLLARSLFERLMAAMKVRNSVAHGFQSSLLDAETVRFLIEVARENLEPELQQHNA